MLINVAVSIFRVIEAVYIGFRDRIRSESVVHDDVQWERAMAHREY
jgi:hypothetical protein